MSDDNPNTMPIVMPPEPVPTRTFDDEPDEHDDEPRDVPPRAFGERPLLVRQMTDAEEGRQESRAIANETLQIQQIFDKFRESNAAGYFEIHRLGPMSLPACERGRIGKVRVADLKTKSLEDVIVERYGSGEYEAIAKRGNHMPVPGGVAQFHIGGADSILVTNEGKAWRRESEGTRPSEDPLMKMLMEQMVNRQGQSGGNDTMAFIAMMKKMDEEAATRREEERDRREAKESAERERKDKIEKEEKDERAKREKAEQAERDRRDKEEREAREKREKREADEAKERDRRWAKQAEDDRADRDLKFKILMEEQKAAHSERIKAMEIQNAGSLGGLDGIKKLKESFVSILVDDMKGRVEQAAGGDAPEGWGDVMKKIAVEKGPDLISQFMQMVQQRSGQPGAPLPPQPEVPALPGPETDVDVDEEESPPAASATAAASTGAAFEQQRKGAAAKANGRVVAFVRLVGTEIMAQSDPAACWYAPQDEANTTLTDLYLLMATPLKTAMQQGWLEFSAACPPAAKGDLDVIANLLKQHPMVGPWIRDFLASGPWTEDDDVPAAGDDDAPPVETPDAASGPDPLQGDDGTPDGT